MILNIALVLLLGMNVIVGGSLDDKGHGQVFRYVLKNGMIAEGLSSGDVIIYRPEDQKAFAEKYKDDWEEGQRQKLNPVRVRVNNNKDDEK